MIHNSARLVPESSACCGWLPLFHDMGLMGVVLYPFYLGMPVYFISPSLFLKKPVQWLKLISDYKCNFTVAPNFAFDICAREITEEQKKGLDLSALQIAYLGAELININTIERFVIFHCN
jgi:Acyl-CoA synthetases (AMP-forming)/AMP-acid ligases II